MTVLSTAFALVSLSILSDSAFAASACKGLLQPSVLATGSKLARPQSQVPVPAETNIAPRLDFDVDNEVIKKSVLSPDGKYVAFEAGTEPNFKLTVKRIADSAILFESSFTQVGHFSFLPTGNALVVNSRTKSEPDKAKLRLLPFKDPSRDQTNSVVPSEQQILPLVESQYHGTGVSAVLGRADLPVYLVIQDSANAIRTVRRQNPAPYTDPMTSLLNQNATIFEAGTNRAVKTLIYDGQVPIAGMLNPHSSLVALNIVNPLVAEAQRQAVIVVDLRNPETILARFNLPADKLVLRTERYDMPISNKVRMSWSPDGKRLLVNEANSGTLAEVDLETGGQVVETRDAENMWPIEAAMILHSGKKLIIHSRKLPEKGDKLFVEGFVLPQGEVATNGNPIFSMNLNLTAHANLRKQDWRQNSSYTLGRDLFEVNKGNLWVIVFPNHLVTISAKPPFESTIISVAEKKQDGRANEISSVVQVADDVLRVSDAIHGVVDIHF